MNRVAGYCPMGCGETLFIAKGDHITCSYIPCPRPGAVDELLEDRETEHIVLFDDEGGFTVKHPLRERLDNELLMCGLHTWIADLAGPPAKPGTYRVRTGSTGWTFARIDT